MLLMRSVIGWPRTCKVEGREGSIGLERLCKCLCTLIANSGNCERNTTSTQGITTQAQRTSHRRPLRCKRVRSTQLHAVQGCS